MIPLSWQTALARKSSLAGSFVALALSVGLLGAMALTIVSAVTGGRTQPRWFTQPGCGRGGRQHRVGHLRVRR